MWNSGCNRHVTRTASLVAMALSAGPSAADAHEAAGVAGGFLSGFAHPLLGLDHVAAMVAVGLWGAFLGAPAIWLLPIVFPLVMAFGAALGIAGVPLPAVETGIAVSAVLLGAMVALAAQPPLWIAAVIVGLCNLPWPRPRHRTARRRQRTCLCRRFRDRHRSVASHRHLLRLDDAMELGRAGSSCGGRRHRARRCGVPLERNDMI